MNLGGSLADSGVKLDAMGPHWSVGNGMTSDEVLTTRVVVFSEDKDCAKYIW